VESILDLHDPYAEIYEAHYGLTQEWASQLVGLGYPTDLALGYDRYTGATDFTLGELAASPPGTEHETFHFVLNNTVIKDNRIPPYGMSYEEARKRNALPVPADQYGGSPGGTYNYWDERSLVPPVPAAVSATIELLYQPTSWEYIQFLDLANDGQNAFLADEGVNMLDAWLNAGALEVRMAKPYVMASTVWTRPACDVGLDNDCDGIVDPIDNCVLIANGPAAGTCYSAGVQVDTDGNGYGDICDGDFNHDGAVNSSDVLVLNADLGTGTSTPGTGTDMNCDGAVNSSDAVLFNPQLGQGFPGP
jgi:hypothetical protein